MIAVVEERSKITSKGQTTIPVAVRRALGVNPGDEISFVVHDHGVSVRSAAAEREDWVITAYLDFLASDMAAHPRNIVPLTEGLSHRIAAAVENVSVDLDDEVVGDVAL